MVYMKLAMILSTLATYSSDYDSAASAAAGGVLAVFYVIVLVIGILSIVAQWKLFAKAGEPGWYSIIPILNVYTLFKIVYGSGWKFILMFIPILNCIVSIALYIRLAQAYGKGVGFGILAVFFTPIALLILAFGDSTYEGPTNSFI